MPYPTRPSDLTTSLVRFLAGFLGSMIVVALLPRTFRLFIRKLFMGVIGEVVTVLVAGLITEQASRKLGANDSDESPTGQPVRRAGTSQRYGM
jgi:hypothetical protein